MINLLTLLTVGTVVASVSKSQHFTKEPSNITAITGHRIRFNCEVENKRGSCQWTKDGFGLGIDEELSGFSRYSYAVSGGRCDLLIDPVLVEDEGEYQCQTGAMPGVPAIKSTPASLTVFQEPGRPHILQAKLGDMMEVVEGQVVQLECDTQGGKPAADIIWRHGDGSRLESEVVDMISTLEDRKVFRTKSVLKFVPKQNEDIYCEAFSEAIKVPKKSPKLRIKLKNSLTAKLEFSKDAVEVGEDVEVDCRVEGSDRILRYYWTLNNKELPEEKTEVLRLENVQAENDKMRIKCRVEAESGERVEVEGRLRVASVLAITRHPANVTVTAGEEFSLDCQAVGPEVVEYVWSREEDNRLAGVGPSLTLVGGKDTVGRYICTAISPSKTPVTSSPATVSLRRIETIQQQDETIYGSVGSTSMLSCKVDNYHNDSVLGWKLEDRIIHSDGLKYKIINQHNSSTLSTNLVIMDTEKTDFTTYKCFVKTTEGVQEMKLELRNEKNSYFIVSLIVNLIGVTIFAFVFIGLYWRRKQRENSVEFMEEQKEIFKTEDKTILEKLLLKNNNFKIDMEFNCDDLINESTGLNLKKSRSLNRFYSAPNGSFASDNTIISYVDD